MIQKHFQYISVESPPIRFVCSLNVVSLFIRFFFLNVYVSSSLLAEWRGEGWVIKKTMILWAWVLLFFYFVLSLTSHDQIFYIDIPARDICLESYLALSVWRSALDVRIWLKFDLKSVLAVKQYNIYNGSRPITWVFKWIWNSELRRLWWFRIQKTMLY